MQIDEKIGFTYLNVDKMTSEHASSSSPQSYAPVMTKESISSIVYGESEDSSEIDEMRQSFSTAGEMGVLIE